MTNNGPAHPALTLVFADANTLTRDCFSLSLRTIDGAITVHPVPSLAAAGALAERVSGVDAVLYNIGSEPEMTAELAAAIQTAMAAFHPAPLIMISDRDDIDMILECLRLGIRGYIVASLGLSVALEAIRLVVAGGTFIPATSLHKLTNPCAPRAPAPAGGGASDNIGGLTPREMAVLNCLREGKSNKIIAYQLGMCENTAKAHVRNVLKKLGATNRTEAAYLAHTRMPGIGNSGGNVGSGTLPKVVNGR
ncbi:LuxR C-terminal-related transcriptional regulator [Azospirillum sp. sgz302134]